MLNDKRQKPTKLDSKKFDHKKIVKYKRFGLKKFQVHANIGGFIKGAIIALECDKKSGSPKIKFWRDRLRDAKKDGCITEYKAPKAKKVDNENTEGNN